MSVCSAVWGLPLVVWSLALHWESDLEYKTSIEEVVVSGLVNLHTQGGRRGGRRELAYHRGVSMPVGQVLKYQGYRGSQGGAKN